MSMATVVTYSHWPLFLLQVGQKERQQAKEFFESAAGKAFEVTVANEAKAGGMAAVLLQLFLL